MDSSGQFDKAMSIRRVGHDNAVIAPAKAMAKSGSIPSRKNRTDPSQKPKNAPPGCQLLKACVPGR